MGKHLTERDFLIGPHNAIKKRDLAYLIADVFSYSGEIQFDNNAAVLPPPQTYSERMKNAGWEPKVAIIDGIEGIKDFLENEATRSTGECIELRK